MTRPRDIRVTNAVKRAYGRCCKAERLYRDALTQPERASALLDLVVELRTFVDIVAAAGGLQSPESAAGAGYQREDRP